MQELLIFGGIVAALWGFLFLLWFLAMTRPIAPSQIGY
jgi:hypothetical protein